MLKKREYNLWKVHVVHKILHAYIWQIPPLWKMKPGYKLLNHSSFWNVKSSGLFCVLWYHISDNSASRCTTLPHLHCSGCWSSISTPVKEGNSTTRKLV